jgi:hypothetical protein
MSIEMTNLGWCRLSGLVPKLAVRADLGDKIVIGLEADVYG